MSYFGKMPDFVEFEAAVDDDDYNSEVDDTNVSDIDDFFYFHNFTLKNDGKNVKIYGWKAIPVEPVDLSHLSYSKRMSYLN